MRRDRMATLLGSSCRSEVLLEAGGACCCFCSAGAATSCWWLSSPAGAAACGCYWRCVRLLLVGAAGGPAKRNKKGKIGREKEGEAEREREQGDEREEATTGLRGGHPRRRSGGREMEAAAVHFREERIKSQ
ncbi:hypothetical protein KY284_020705 [Solanum tuberosum]|nr:hypothetical protein KY284_020705 [Solanum tuberosum]